MDKQRENQRHHVPEIAASVAAAAAVAIFFGWPIFHRWNVKSDLRDYHRAVRESDCSLESKLTLLDHVDWLRDQTDQENTVSGFQWIEFDDIVREMLNDGVTDHEVTFLHREFRRLRREFDAEE